MAMGSRNNTILLIAAVFLCAGAAGAFAVWYKLHRIVPQPADLVATQRGAFLYGSAGAEESAGIPYWIWLALPRLFPEYLPGPGGYASLGFSWEEAHEMPAGFSKQRIGYVRVAGNCALCHAYSSSNGPDAAPSVFAAGPGHTVEAQALMAFYKRCAQDPRFNATNILDEVAMETRLSTVDSLLYRFCFIPQTRKRFLEGAPVIVDRELWQHAQNPAADPALRKRMRDLESGLAQTEKDQLSQYLRTFP